MRNRQPDLIVAAFSLIALLLTASRALPEADWPGHMGPRRDGRATGETGLLREWPKGGPKMLWKYERVGPGWSAVAIAGGSIFVTGNEGDNQMLICVGLDGAEKWRVAQGPRALHRNYPGARSTPTVDGDHVYVTGGGGLVTCHDAADGKIVWTRDMSRDFGGKVGGWRYAESVLILGDLAIVTPGGKNAIVALDK